MLRGLCRLAVLLLTSQIACADYLATLIQQARTQNLAQHPQWLALLHYRPHRLLNGVTSLIDDPLFFLAADGKTNSLSELEATLTSFFSTTIIAPKEEHPQCAFIARYRWLKETLHFDPDLLPQQSCERFTSWVDRIQPYALTLVFPTAYMNNPSSMFGHTFLRFDTREQNIDTNLLAYAANYGAVTGTDNGAAFAIKGIFGGYGGYVSIGPYYEKVKIYSNLESRDIWEYQLKLQPAEVSLLLAHIWELRGIYSDYYFFSENCAYELMTLLDVARPELKLREQFGLWVLPVDTVRRLYQHDLVADAVYRPAAGTKLQFRSAALPNPQQRLIRQLVNYDIDLDGAELQALNPSDRATIYTLSYDYLRYDVSEKYREREPAIALSRRLLEARSQLDVQGFETAEPRRPTQPEQGHPTTLVAIATGRANNNEFLAFRFRPAYHDLLDPQAGYTNGAQIEFLELTAKYQPAHESWLIDSLKLVDIISAAPRNILFKPISWLVRAGAKRPAQPRRRGTLPNPTALTFQFAAGAGLTTELASQELLFGFVKTVIDANEHLNHRHALGFGLELGAVIPATSIWNLGITTAVDRYPVSDQYTRVAFEVDQRFTVSRQSTLRIVYRHNYVDENNARETQVAWQYFF